MSGKFELVSPFSLAGDQPAATDALARGVLGGDRIQTLLGVTGSGKTMAMARVVELVQKPTLVLCHNKTLGAQLCAEFRDFFPNNAVEYFVSYFDYYQPEAYIASTDTYIEKDSSINDEIERLRHSATQSLLTRPDTLIVASVSCIFGLGSPSDYMEMSLKLSLGQEIDRDLLLRKLVDMQYRRNDLNLVRGTFRVRGDTLEYVGVEEELVHRIEFFGDTIDAINVVNIMTGEYVESKDELLIFPAKHFITPDEKLRRAVNSIEAELEDRLKYFKDSGKLLEAQRLEQRTRYDLDMLREVGYCNGIENYSRHLTGREPGSTPSCLIDFFPKDWLLFVDESHVTLPQVHGMYGGDRSRKLSLVEHGFRLPSALDNRPLTYDEFDAHLNQAIYVSATPGTYEIGRSARTVEMIIRPTGLVDPEVEVRPTRNQVDDLMEEIRLRAARKERVLVTTLTKKMAEDLTDFLLEMGFKVRYLHSEVDTLERVAILRDLRLGVFDVLVGINLLREGLDLPEVSLVGILDADKEGYLRSATSLIQTIGRASRHVEGKVVMYADNVTESMARALGETKRRRERQIAYNLEHGIEPRSVRKEIRDILSMVGATEETAAALRSEKLPKDVAIKMAAELEAKMREFAGNLEFEKAAALRDELIELRRQIGGNESLLFQGKAPKIFERALKDWSDDGGSVSVGDLRAVLFDLDDTLHDDTLAYKGAAERVARDVAERWGIDAAELKKAYVAQAEGFWTGLTGAQLATKLAGVRVRLWAAALAEVGLADPALAQRCADDYNRYRAESLALFPGAMELLEHLRADGLKLGLLTNGFAETHREKIALLNLSDAFDEIFIADEVGMLKPDPLLFVHACAVLGVAPEHTAMVGDRYERDVRGAHAAGLATIWMNVHGGTLPAGAPAPTATVPDLAGVAAALGYHP